MAYFPSDRFIDTKLRKGEWDRVRIYWTSVTADIQVIAVITDEASSFSRYETYVMCGRNLRGPCNTSAGPWKFAVAVAKRLEREVENLAREDSE